MALVSVSQLSGMMSDDSSEASLTDSTDWAEIPGNVSTAPAARNILNDFFIGEDVC